MLDVDIFSERRHLAGEQALKTPSMSISFSAEPHG